MNRIPLWGWVAALGAGLGGWWYFSRHKTGATAGTAAAPAFSQAQEVQDFQIFSALTSAQQGADLNFVGQMLSLFSGGTAPGAASSVGTGGGSSPTPAPAGNNIPGYTFIPTPSDAAALVKAGIPIYGTTTSGGIALENTSGATTLQSQGFEVPGPEYIQGS